MNIRPLHDRIVVRRIEEENKNCWWYFVTWFSTRKTFTR